MVEHYSLEEIYPAVLRLNRNSPRSEQITSGPTYDKYRHKDERLLPWGTALYWHEKKTGAKRGAVAIYIRGQIPKPKVEHYSLEEIYLAVLRLNRNSPRSEQITSGSTYKDYRHKDERLSSWGTVERWHKKKTGASRGAVDIYIRGQKPGSCPTSFSSS